MSRPKKQTVEYFPHYVMTGKTLYILESLYGNDGYSFWFKLLEILGDSKGHYYDCSVSSNWQFLTARTHIDESTAEKIITTLIDLGKIDPELWEHKIIWVQNFVDNLSDVYKKRMTEVPHKPSFPLREPDNTDSFSSENPTSPIVSVPETPQRKEKESKEKESKEKNTKKDFDFFFCLPDYLPVLENWLSYKRQRGETYKTQQSLEALYRKLFNLSGGDVEVARMIIEQSQANNWAGLFELKNKCSSVANHSKSIGVGERIENGRRTYGTGTATIPMSAPPRPSDRYAWNSESQNWIML